ncbi:MAG: exodeoxyribonuclease VII large subunit [Bacteroidales bacterium]|nr:exodeoxyribonuclease VII large subunit [Bacteroidales bacterium]
MDNKLTLLELNQRIKETLNREFQSTYWVIAEISELKINRKGHCYLDLVEKDELGDRIVAKAKGIVWSYTFRMLKPYFETTTGREFKQGLKIMVNVSVEFHELYGYSLYIHDIEPSYTLGEIARRRLEVIKKLEDEGIIEMNKQLPLSQVPQKIAVISSKTAAGYRDFIEQLNNNPYGYIFYSKLFPAYMQGDEAEDSIIKALEKIYQYEDLFDAVAIIRGGGAHADLGCFDQYHLAANVAQFPLPVITGIGHEKDESVVDMTAHTKMKTPTAVADFFVSKAYEYEEKLLGLRDVVVERTNQYINLENQKLRNLYSQIYPNVKSILEKSRNILEIRKEKFLHIHRNFLNKKQQNLTAYSKKLVSSYELSFQKNFHELKNYERNIGNLVRNYMKSQKKHMENLAKAKEYLDPKNVLKRGFSITQKDNQTVKSSRQVKKGDTIKTCLYEGKLVSQIDYTEKEENIITGKK